MENENQKKMFLNLESITKISERKKLYLLLLKCCIDSKIRKIINGMGFDVLRF